MSTVPEVELDDLSNDELLNPTSYTYIFKDLIAGSYSGFIITLTGFPFDTLKTRMQIYNTTLIQTIKKTLREEKVRNIFNGLAFPFYSVPVVNAIVFSGFEFFKRYLTSINVTDSFSQGLYSGMFAGLVNSFVVSPIELVKCRLQIQEAGAGAKQLYKGSFDCARQVIQVEGWKGIYRGTIATMSREIPAYGGQFLAYESLKEYFIEHRKSFGYFEKFIAGGFAGIACWVASYPQDIIKTKLQCDLLMNNFRPKYKNHGIIIRDGGIISCAKDIIQTEGIKGFWRGFSACLIRAFYANACGFMAYEQARAILFPSLARQ